MKILILGYLLLGVYTVAEWRDISSNSMELAKVGGLHVAAVVFLAFSIFMARKQESKKFMGLSSGGWGAASLISYVVGAVSGFFI